MGSSAGGLVLALTTAVTRILAIASERPRCLDAARTEGRTAYVRECEGFLARMARMARTSSGAVPSVPAEASPDGADGDGSRDVARHVHVRVHFAGRRWRRRHDRPAIAAVAAIVIVFLHGIAFHTLISVNAVVAGVIIRRDSGAFRTLRWVFSQVDLVGHTTHC